DVDARGRPGQRGRIGEIAVDLAYLVRGLAEIAQVAGGTHQHGHVVLALADQSPHHGAADESGSAGDQYRAHARSFPLVRHQVNPKTWVSSAVRSAESPLPRAARRATGICVACTTRLRKASIHQAARS